MQFLYNLVFVLIRFLLGPVGALVAPDFIHDMILDIARYVAVANFYFPVDTLAIVGLTCFLLTLALIVLSAILNIAPSFLK